MPAAPQSAWSLLDDPAEWPGFGRALDDGDAAGRWESQVVVEGMHCAACALTVEAALRRRAGRARGRGQRGQPARREWSGRPRPRPSALDRRRRESRRLPRRCRRATCWPRCGARRERGCALWRWLVAGFCMMQVMMYACPAYIAAAGRDHARHRGAAALGLLGADAAGAAVFLPALLRAAPGATCAQRRIGMDVPVALGIADHLRRQHRRDLRRRAGRWATRSGSTR